MEPKKENIIIDKTFKFSLDIISLYKKLQNEKEYILSKQLVRSATSIGANVEEASAGEIVAIGGMKNVTTGETISSESEKVHQKYFGSELGHFLPVLR